jgi:hypothetical protein
MSPLMQQNSVRWHVRKSGEPLRILSSSIQPFITHLNSGTMERVASAIRFYLGKNEIPTNLLDIISL